MDERELKVYEMLKNLNIEYVKHDHIPVFTVEESKEIDSEIPGAHCKNLFLRNRKGDTHYLVVMECNKNINLKEFSKFLSVNQLSFASSERMEKYLGLTPGSVSPFGLINDTNKSVKVYIDEDFKGFEYINFHPNINTSTLTIKVTDFKKFLECTGNEFQYIKIPVF